MLHGTLLLTTRGSHRLAVLPQPRRCRTHLGVGLLRYVTDDGFVGVQLDGETRVDEYQAFQVQPSKQCFRCGAAHERDDLYCGEACRTIAALAVRCTACDAILARHDPDRADGLCRACAAEPAPAPLPDVRAVVSTCDRPDCSGGRYVDETGALVRCECARTR